MASLIFMILLIRSVSPMETDLFVKTTFRCSMLTTLQFVTIIVPHFSTLPVITKLSPIFVPMLITFSIWSFC